MGDFSGKTAEFIALQYMRLKGYHLVEHNYVTGRGTGAGEVDIIMCNQNTLVFVEVKKRKTLEKAAYAITPKQMQRIRRGAEAFLAHHSEFANFNVRFDAILVESMLKIQHIENAF
ncbi:MAG: YraN family protein [Alphaproteobacteria bacterium]|nr:YraN family protein [Alphaproteobacteria bacterium]MBR6663791.1 YraN family protein [Alphaproteobacteria bacterium]